MTDALLATTDREDALTQAYVAAVAAGAGYVIAQRVFDRDGVDLTIEAGGRLRPKIDLQLKATINLDETEDPIPYPLKIRNYNLLREPTQTPRLLVVLHLPRDKSKWLNLTPEELVMRNCAYWLSLRDAPEVDVVTSKTVYIPKANRFDIDSLILLMDKSRTGVI